MPSNDAAGIRECVYSNQTHLGNNLDTIPHGKTTNTAQHCMINSDVNQCAARARQLLGTGITTAVSVIGMRGIKNIYAH